MSNARLVLHEKQIEGDGSIIEIKIWSVSRSALRRHGVKYSLVYIRGGKRILGYDNAHGQDHRHYLGENHPYSFRNIGLLLKHFRRDIERITQGRQNES